MYLTYYVYLDGIKGSDWLQECTNWKTSKLASKCKYRGLLFIFLLEYSILMHLAQLDNSWLLHNEQCIMLYLNPRPLQSIAYI